MTRYFSRILLFVFLLALAACANRSRGPQGGPKDVTPPKPLSSSPKNGTTNFNEKKIEIRFDELISLNNPIEKVIVSPPQANPATFRASGDKLYITLNDTLKPNCTYSIDFNNSIVDVNEQNVLKGYSFSFSTGKELDTLQMSGTVLDAATLNPVENCQVSIYSDLSDNAFKKEKPLRICKTDETGHFCFKNVKPGNYHIFALNDLNRDYLFNDPNEAVAFQDALISPHASREMVTDTLHIPLKAKEKTVKDSLLSHERTVFYPNNIVLRSFKEAFTKQYLLKSERKQPYKVTFFFHGQNKERPVIKPITYQQTASDLIQYSMNADTITYWVGDSVNYTTDSLRFAVSYKKTDSIGAWVNHIDTVQSFYQNIKKTVKKKKKQKPTEAQYLTVLNNLTNNLEINTPIYLKFDMPIEAVAQNKVHLYSKADTVWQEVPAKAEKCDDIGLKFKVDAKFDPNLVYKLTLDSAAFRSKFNVVNKGLNIPFAVKGAEQYSNLKVILTNFNEKAVIQLLNDKDIVVKQLPAKSEGTVFDYVKPGEYYLRMFIDDNQNGKWDTGKYDEKKQPEEVYYFDNILKLRANWEVEQEWDYLMKALPMQKPLKLKPSKASSAKK